MLVRVFVELGKGLTKLRDNQLYILKQMDNDLVLEIIEMAGKRGIRDPC